MKYQNHGIEPFFITTRVWNMSVKGTSANYRVTANNTGVGAKTGFDIFLGDIWSEDAETRTGLVKKRS